MYVYIQIYVYQNLHTLLYVKLYF